MRAKDEKSARMRAFSRLTGSILRAGSKVLGGDVDKGLADAVSRGSKGEVDVLLSLGGNPNARTVPTLGRWRVGHGMMFTALYAIDGHADGEAVFKALLAGGGDPNARDDDGKTLVMTAARGVGGGVAMGLLAAAGADANLKDKKGWTALHHAVDSRQAVPVREVRRLLEMGADAKLVNEDWNSPLMMAARFGLAGSVAELAVASDLNARSREEKTALMMAAGDQRALAGLSALLRCGADHGLTDWNGETALMAAARAGNAAAARELLAAGADARVATSLRSARPGMTALCFGVERGDAETVRELLAGMGADAALEQMDSKGWSGLRQSFGHEGHVEVEALLRELRGSASRPQESEKGEESDCEAAGGWFGLEKEWDPENCKYKRKAVEDSERKAESSWSFSDFKDGDGGLEEFCEEGEEWPREGAWDKERREVLTVVRQGSTHTRLTGAMGTVFVEKGSLDKEGMLELDTAREGDVVRVVFSGEKALTARNETAQKAEGSAQKRGGGLLSAKRVGP